MERLEQENVLLRQELDRFKTEHDKRQKRIAALIEENQHLSEELSRQRAMNRRITDETRAILAEMVPLDQCNSNCPSYDLCRKRILVVGGISRMASLYRELIENSGGVFEYHDGIYEKGFAAARNPSQTGGCGALPGKPATVIRPVRWLKTWPRNTTKPSTCCPTPA